MNRRLSILIVLAVVVVAGVIAAASAGGGNGDEAAAADPGAITSPTEGPTPPGTGAPDAPDEATAAPSATDGPTALSPPAVPPQPVELPDQLASVTEPWPTDWSLRTIDLSELLVGIPALDPRDLIRPLDDPIFESVAAGEQWLDPRELGILFEFEGVTRFYPIRIITSHEVINDEANGVPFVITYCPLCNTAAAFKREVGGEVLRFGVSGLLRNSDLVMWDSATTSLWQQINGEGIVGRFAGVQLEFIPTALVRFEDFRTSHPDGEVLSRDTGFPFDYGLNAYVGYSSRGAPFGQFFQGELDDRLPALERVVGVRVGDSTKAYPFSVISEDRTVNDVVAGQPVTVWWGAADTGDPLDTFSTAGGQAIGTGVAYVASSGGQVLTFSAVDDTTFIDTETGTTWNLLGEAIEGPLTGSELELAVHQNEFWFAWAAFNEGSPVHGL
jgi:hypothetical protein